MRNKFGLVVLGMALAGVSGCSRVPDAVNPVSWYRDVTGLSKNDDLGKGENEQNLAEGGNEPYPNLATVPSPPDTQLSGVDRDRLQKSLIADRNNAQYSADNLRAGNVASAVPPPAPPAANKRDTSATFSSAPSSPPSSPLPPAESSSAPSPPPAASSPPPEVAPAPNPAATGSSPPPSSAGGNQLGSNSEQRKPPVRGSEAPPAESPLQSPAISNLPQGESATPPPPPPRIPPPNAVASGAPPSRPPGSTPAQPASAPGNARAAAAGHAPGRSDRIANVGFTPGSAYLSDARRDTIAEIVKQHKIDGGTIRVVGFGEASGKDAAVAGLTLALDRAQAVAVALTNAGVAPKDIAVEAAPVAAKGGTDAPRAEVYFEH